MPDADNSTQNMLLTPIKAAEYLKLAQNTLSVWRSTKRQEIPYIKLGRSVRYRLSDLDEWLAANTISAKV